MIAGDILPAVKDDKQRSEIFERICLVEYMISSICMCIENSKWAGVWRQNSEKLLPVNGKDSISQRFRALHNGQANMKV